MVVNLGWMLTFELFPVLNHLGPAHEWMWRIGRTVYVLGMMALPVSLGAANGPDEVLPTIVKTLAESLHLPYVALALPNGENFRVAAESGAPHAVYFTWPLVYQRQAVGQLRLAPRVLGESFKADEWQVIESVAYHVSAAVHDLLLDQELRRQR